MKLRVLEGPQAGQEFQVAFGGALIGRGATCQIVLSDGEASREHARIYYAGQNYWVEDLRSTNGVLLNGQRITSREPLREGDTVRVGVTVLKIAAVGDGPPVPAAETDRFAAIGQPAQPDAETPTLPGIFRPTRSGPPLVPILLGALAVLLTATGVWWLMLDRQPSPPTPADLPLVANAADELAPAESDTEPEVEPDAGPASLAPAVSATPTSAPASSAATATAATATAPHPAAPASSLLAPVAHYLWLDTAPSGAKVELNGEAKGTTPLLLEQLPEGRYELRFLLADHEPLSRFVEVPNDGQRQSFTLRQHNQTCRIDATPPGAFIRRGPQLLGTVPYVLRDLPPGRYPITVFAPGYESVTQDAELDAARPTALAVSLAPRLATLQVVTIPPGATVLLDQQPIGVTPPGTTSPWVSAPLRTERLLPGTHRITATREGVTANLVELELTASETRTLQLIVWLPNLRFTLTSAPTRERVAMRVADSPEELVVITFAGETVRLPLVQLQTQAAIPREEGLLLLEAARKTLPPPEPAKPEAKPDAPHAEAPRPAVDVP